MFIEYRTYRYHGHSMSDPGITYRTRDEIKHVRDYRDPIGLVKHMLLENNCSTENELKDFETIMSLINFVENDLDIPNSELELIQMSNPKTYKPVLTMWSYIYNFFYPQDCFIFAR